MTLKLKGILKNTTKQLGQVITAQAIIELSVSFSNIVFRMCLSLLFLFSNRHLQLANWLVSLFNLLGGTAEAYQLSYY